MIYRSAAKSLAPDRRLRLTEAALRSATALPERISTTALGRYLDRLRWMFGNR
jgi:hypothetical protein